MTLSREAKIAHNLGLIVLASQEIEKSLKFLSSVLGDDKAPIMQRHAHLEKKPFGEIVSILSSKAESGGKDLQRALGKYVKLRNAVVHHFGETYAIELASDNLQAIVVDLANRATTLQGLARDLQKASTSVAKFILEQDAGAS